MSKWYGVYLLLVIIMQTPNVNCDNFCGNQKHFEEPRGKIETSLEITQNVIMNCTWSIKTPKNSVIFIKLEYLQLGPYDEIDENQENCLRITDKEEKYEHIKIYSDATYFDSISIPANELLITLEIKSESYLSLSYSSYIVNCSYIELKCYNSRFYARQYDKICTDGMLICGKLCRFENANCGDFCYDIHKQRCDEVVDCPTAEDEQGCYPKECPDQIRCLDEPKCLTTHQICDEKFDCQNGYDESNCPSFFCKEDEPNCNIERSRESYSEPSDFNYIIVVVFGVCFMLFIYLICKCLAKRDNVRNILDNPLDVPLPPFTGPGESSHTTEDFLYTDDDFRPGGEIYESFSANMEKIRSKRQSKMEEEVKNITFVKPPDDQKVLNKYFNGIKPVLSEDMAALATLKITRDRCYGLRKTKSEERPMTRLLFIDNKDDESDDSDTDDNPTRATNFNKAAYRAAHSKSDTDYIRRKGAGVNFV